MQPHKDSFQCRFCDKEYSRSCHRARHEKKEHDELILGKRGPTPTILQDSDSKREEGEDSIVGILSKRKVKNDEKSKSFAAKENIRLSSILQCFSSVNEAKND